MLADELALGPETVVYDLGSGFGRATTLFAMHSGGRSVGVELDASRHNAATRLRQHGLTSGLLTPDEAERVVLFHGDAFAPGVFADATHVYMLSTYGATISLSSGLRSSQDASDISLPTGALARTSSRGSSGRSRSPRRRRCAGWCPRARSRRRCSRRTTPGGRCAARTSTARGWAPARPRAASAWRTATWRRSSCTTRWTCRRRLPSAAGSSSTASATPQLLHQAAPSCAGS